MKRMLLGVEDSFHNRIYRDSNINLRDEQELALLEELMLRRVSSDIVMRRGRFFLR